MPIDSARMVSYSTSTDTIIVSVTMFAISDVQFWWPWSMLVQGHPWSKYIGPTESPLAGSYLTAFESNILCVFIFDIFDEKVFWPRFKTVQGHPRSVVMVPVGSPLVACYLTAIVSNIVSVTALLPRSRTAQSYQRLKVIVQSIDYGWFDFYCPHHRICHHFEIFDVQF